MAELIDKGAVLARLRTIGAFEYNDTRRNAFKEILDMLEAQPTTTEAEIRAMAYNRFSTETARQFIDFDAKHDFISIGVCLDIIAKVAEQLKEE